MVDGAPGQGKAEAIFSHPYMAAFSLLVGVIGTIYGVVSYYSSLVNRDLCVSQHPVRSVFEPSKVIKELSLVWDGKPLDQTAAVVQIAVWNRGREDIQGSDVLEPLRITLPEGCEVLKVSVANQTRQICGLIATKSSAREVEVHWRILERSDGGIVQLVFSGDPSATVGVSGTIRGQGTTKLFKHTVNLVSPQDQFRKSVQVGPADWSGLAPALFLLVAVFALTKASRKLGVQTDKTIVVIWVLTVPIVVLSVWFVVSKFRNASDLSPFGF